MPTSHSRLTSPSAAERWINCPPSALLNAACEDTTSSYAQEGTDAHELCEHLLRKAMGQDTVDPRTKLQYYDEEMEDAAQGYAAYVLEILEAERQRCKDPLLLIEQRIDFSRWAGEGSFGTSDAIIIADGRLSVLDFKHGSRLVQVEGNAQVMCYGLGALAMFDGVFDVDEVALHIYQPRRSNVSSTNIPKSELYEWAESVLGPAATLARAGEGEFSCGKWCTFCKVAPTCRKRAEANMALARFDFRKPPTLDDAEVSEVLERVDDLVAWASDVKDHALQLALGGKQWSGFKLVEGRSIRRYTNEGDVASAVIEAGGDPYEKKLLGITAMQKLLGKSQFEQLLGGLLEKPAGKPTLVPEDDRRPAINTAKHDFEEN